MCGGGIRHATQQSGDRVSYWWHALFECVPVNGVTVMTNAELIPEDGPEREDVRFLGRLLGDVIRAQEGEATFDRIEAIRKAAVAVHRFGGRAHEERLTARLDELSLADTLRPSSAAAPASRSSPTWRRTAGSIRMHSSARA